VYKLIKRNLILSFLFVVSHCMKNVLVTTALLEFGTGLVLVAVPSTLVTILFGVQLDTPVGLTIARIAGVALLTIGTACWLARPDSDSRVARGLVGALVIYNVGATAVFVYAGLALRLSGIGLWPVVVAHAAMAAWCISCLLQQPPHSGKLKHS